MQILANIDFEKYFDPAVEGDKVITPMQRFTETRERMEAGANQWGDTLPWQGTDSKLRLRPGEVTIWAGINGHGKSLVTSQIASHLIARNSRTLIASMEMPVSATCERLIKQIVGTGEPTIQFIRRAMSWMSRDRLWIYDQLDTVPAKRILGMSVFAVTTLGISHVFIDSLMKCGIRHDNYEAQEDFVNHLCGIAKHYGVHIHLIHHMRKGSSEDDIPNKFDLKGSGGISDLVDNVCIVHRNKRKERELEQGKEIDDRKIPDSSITVAKQRHGDGWEGRIPLWFHKPSNQFLAWSGARPVQLELSVDELVEI